MTLLRQILVYIHYLKYFKLKFYFLIELLSIYILFIIFGERVIENKISINSKHLEIQCYVMRKGVGVVYDLL